MRGTSQVIYAVILRTQAVFGLLLASWLISMVLGRGQYATAPLIIGVIAGVISLSCVWSFLTPSWLRRPHKRKQLALIVSAHVFLPALYGYVAISAVVAAGIPDPLSSQIAVVMAAWLCASSLTCLVIGVRLCLRNGAAPQDEDVSVVTELVLPRATPTVDAQEDAARMSRAS